MDFKAEAAFHRANYVEPEPVAVPRAPRYPDHILIGKTVPTVQPDCPKAQSRSRLRFERPKPLPPRAQKR